MTTASNPGWYRDPTGRFVMRYWDGRQWTNQVNSGGANATDEPRGEMRFVPPSPETDGPQARSPVAGDAAQQFSGSSTGTVFAVALGIIAALIVVFVLAIQSDDGSSTTEPPATTEAPTETTGSG